MQTTPLLHLQPPSPPTALASTTHMVTINLNNNSLSISLTLLLTHIHRLICSEWISNMAEHSQEPSSDSEFVKHLKGLIKARNSFIFHSFNVLSFLCVNGVVFGVMCGQCHYHQIWNFDKLIIIKYPFLLFGLCYMILLWWNTNFIPALFRQHVPFVMQMLELLSSLWLCCLIELSNFLVFVHIYAQV